jgi:hypothetical protein
MAKQNKKPTHGPEGLNFMDLIHKVGNDTLASMRKDIVEGKLRSAKKAAFKKKKTS